MPGVFPPLPLWCIRASVQFLHIRYVNPLIALVASIESIILVIIEHIKFLICRLLIVGLSFLKIVFVVEVDVGKMRSDVRVGHIGCSADHAGFVQSRVIRIVRDRRHV